VRSFIAGAWVKRGSGELRPVYPVFAPVFFSRALTWNPGEGQRMVLKVVPPSTSLVCLPQTSATLSPNRDWGRGGEHRFSVPWAQPLAPRLPSNATATTLPQALLGRGRHPPGASTGRGAGEGALREHPQSLTGFARRQCPSRISSATPSASSPPCASERAGITFLAALRRVVSVHAFHFAVERSISIRKPTDLMREATGPRHATPTCRAPNGRVIDPFVHRGR